MFNVTRKYCSYLDGIDARTVYGNWATDEIAVPLDDIYDDIILLLSSFAKEVV